jgi:hypothetical protein
MPNGVAVVLPVELAPSSTDTPIELAIGEATAVAASRLAAEIDEWRVNKRQPETMRNAADAIATLYELRVAALATGEIDNFEAIARAAGFRTLRQYCNNSDGLIATLIDGTLEILANVVRAQVS